MRSAEVSRPGICRPVSAVGSPGGPKRLTTPRNRPSDRTLWKTVVSGAEGGGAGRRAVTEQHGTSDSAAGRPGECGRPAQQGVGDRPVRQGEQASQLPGDRVGDVEDAGGRVIGQAGVGGAPGRLRTWLQRQGLQGCSVPREGFLAEAGLVAQGHGAVRHGGGHGVRRRTGAGVNESRKGPLSSWAISLAKSPRSGVLPGLQNARRYGRHRNFCLSERSHAILYQACDWLAGRPCLDRGA